MDTKCKRSKSRKKSLRKRRLIISGITILAGFILLLKAEGEVFNTAISTHQLALEAITGLVIVFIGFKIGGRYLTRERK